MLYYLVIYIYLFVLFVGAKIRHLFHSAKINFCCFLIWGKYIKKHLAMSGEFRIFAKYLRHRSGLRAIYNTR